MTTLDSSPNFLDEKSFFLSFNQIKDLTVKLNFLVETLIKGDSSLSFSNLLNLTSSSMPEILSLPSVYSPSYFQALDEMKELFDKADNPASSFIRTLYFDGHLPTQNQNDFFPLLQGKRIAVWGAGPLGLCLSFLLTTYGAEVELYEKRGENVETEIFARTPNVSWKDFEKVLKPVLPGQDFQQLFQTMMDYGAVIDPHSKKLRGSIGALQEAFINRLRLRKNFSFRPGVCASEYKLLAHHFDTHVIASGIHSMQFLKPKNFAPYRFEGGINHLLITTQMLPSNLETGFHRQEWEENQKVEGMEVSWRRKNINVQTKQVFEREIERFVFNLKKRNYSSQAIDKVKDLLNYPKMAHIFYFGQHNDRYFYQMDHYGYPSITEKVCVDSWMSARSFDKRENQDWFYLGDATGATHPLAAIGTYLSFKNSVEYLKYNCMVKFVDDFKLNRGLKIKAIALKIFETRTFHDRLMVFLQARLCSHYYHFKTLYKK